ncbi:class I SAM-dependent methyltransferase [Lederbergia galactosidilytica]|uniref:SAM-dependent methyltransferase n=1 Tax=Lederbergia galactosidilytica TaxID=217031 RepID=A0A0Q9XXG8_9BACI|nr:class I SAM-dependent methyltransferase [Lederbergia galactosidilytica]KRG11929.1 SAM-dependent methyltransferase [Lederbergia galactosidilytica]KRG12617.1 SAM-dependent methyltransferase [Virgibacillus soli]MBP1916103.1 SAM-dependent methyltransferase [Lederbergia galactosidilytica]OAK68442.1 SAM-dependent methyltransferase [Lederbergia galactosidilytica]
MKQNKYNDPKFFSAYEQMPRSVKGLEGAGEWHIVKELMGDLKDKDVLDLGCGFGWHCRYAREQQARSVIGVDISERMIEKASEMTNDPSISYKRVPIEDIEFSNAQFDIVISSLAFHYIQPFQTVCAKVYNYLRSGGSFVFSVEHPIFTSRNEQDWYYDDQGNRLHWPVDNYQLEGVRETNFLNENVTKYHRTISTYMNDLILSGFTIKAVKESVPSDDMLKDPEMKDETRRPMFLMIAAEKEHS